MRRALALLVLFILWVSASPASGAGDAPRIPWRLEGWRYRVIYPLSSLDAETREDVRSGLAYAALDVRTAGRERKDAADVRVTDEEGNLLRAWIGKPDSFGVRRIYCRPGRADYVVVYFGNPAAAELPPQTRTVLPADSSLHGLELTAYLCPTSLRPLSDTHDLERLLPKLKSRTSARVSEARLSSSSKALRSVTGPFANLPVIAVFRGYIFAPWDGEYFFGTDSHGPSFLLVDGKQVAAWPGKHWKHGSYVNGGTVRLRRGTHRFAYVNHRLTGNPVFASAGWRPPGWPDSFEIPSSFFVRYALLSPAAAQLSGGAPLPEAEVISHENVSLNGGPPMAHYELRAVPGTPDPIWLVSCDGDSGGAFPLRLHGGSCHLFLSPGRRWKAALLSNGKKALELDLPLRRTRYVCALYARAELDGLPPAVYRGAPFGALLNVPYTSPFPYPVDFRVKRLLGEKTAGTVSLRRLASPRKHTVADLTFHPMRGDGVALADEVFPPGEPEPVPGFYSSRFVMECFAAGYPVSSFAFRFLAASDPLPDDLRFEGGRLTAGGDALVLLAEVEDDASFRRWEILRGLAKLGWRPKGFVVAGDTLSGRGDGLVGGLASALKKKGLPVLAAPASPGGRFLSSLPGLLRAMEPGEADCLVLAAGFADSFRRTPPRELEAVLHAVADRAREKGFKRIVLLLPPVSPGMDDLVRPYRVMLSDLARRLRLDVADLSSLLGSDAFLAPGCAARYPSASALERAVRSLAADLAR